MNWEKIKNNELTWVEGMYKKKICFTFRKEKLQALIWEREEKEKREKEKKEIKEKEKERIEIDVEEKKFSFIANPCEDLLKNNLCLELN